MAYEKLVSEIMVAEGWPKFTDKPNDRGGPTKGGITLGALTTFLGRQATVDELKALPEATARQIYEQNYIVRPGFALIDDERVVAYLVDIGVTSGQKRAIRYLQRVVGAADDGNLGPKTAAMANIWDPRRLLGRLVAYRAIKMAALVQEDPSQLEWIEGWITRAVKPLNA